MKEMEIYTWTYCPFCIEAKKLLDDKSIPYREILIDGDEAKRRKLYERTGQNTVPFIFIDERFIGGYTELRALDDQGELEDIVK